MLSSTPTHVKLFCETDLVNSERSRRDTPPGSLLARNLSKFWRSKCQIFSTAFFVLSAREHSFESLGCKGGRALHSTFKVLPALTVAL